MKRFLFLLAFFSVLAFSQPSAARTNFKTYNNARFGYTISYPANLLAPQGEADNGDGQTFTGEGVKMTVFGTNFLETKNFQDEFNVTLAKYRAENISYKFYRKDYFVFSGKSDGKIFYQKVMEKSASGVYVTVIIEYDESKCSIYDKLIPRIMKSFE